MSLTLDAIYQPIAEFFLQLFQTDAGSPVFFRFDKFGSVISDEDFIDPAHPELGYLSGLAMEKFSDLVNHIPFDTHDTMNILLSDNSIDSTYFLRLLTPAMPLFPPGVDDATKQAIMDTFNRMKADAVKLWDTIKAESLSGLMLQYKPSLATPQDWGDKTKTALWTHHSFTITESTTALPPGVSPIDKLWMLKIDDDRMTTILDLPDLKKKLRPDQPDPTELPPLKIADRIEELRKRPGPLPEITDTRIEITHQPIREGGIERAVLPSQEITLPATSLRVAAQLQPAAAENFATAPAEPAIHALNTGAIQPSVIDTERIGVTPVGERAINGGELIDRNDLILSKSVNLHDNYLKEQYSELDISKRIIVNQYLGQYAPSNTVQTSSISIEFDYCLVHARRPWLVDVFLNSTSWYIPTEAKGAVTSVSAIGGFPLIPIGFLAIRNLSILANWTEQDRANASLATNFGPFKVSTDIVNNTVSHPGLQVVAWILQKMPDLPPNSPPAQ